MKTLNLCILTLALFLTGIPLSLADQASLKTPHVQVNFISETTSVQAGQKLNLGLQFKLEEGWHTYWKNPGDSGEPVKATFSSKPIAEFSPLEFPTPERIPMGPLLNFGYSNEVVFLSQVKVPEDLGGAQEFKVMAKASWLVCEEECIPEEGVFHLSLPVLSTGNPPSSAEALLLQTARKKLPQAWQGGPLQWTHSDGGVLLSTDLSSVPPELRKTKADFFPKEGGLLQAAAPPQVEWGSDKLYIVLKPETHRSFENLPGLLVLGSQAFAIEATPPSKTTRFFFSFLFAFIGGLLLNLMPCVFPVLSLKALAWAKTEAKGQENHRRAAWLYTLGVLASFWILAGLLWILKGAGQALGWGFQLQSPEFVLLLAYLFFVMGLGFLGLWQLGERWMGVGNRFTRRQDAWGSFFTGILATVVATPCMAPFVGSTLGIALSQNTLVSWALLSSLALGLASPFILLAYFPKLLKWLPKPGRWMELFKQAMAFPLFATTLWLLWVFSLQTEITSLWWALGGIFLLSLGLWIAHQIPIKQGGVGLRYLKLGILLSALVLSGTTGLLGITTPKPEGSSISRVPGERLGWIPFSFSALEELKKEKKPVFLNFTAAWCITCQLNDRLVFRNSEVEAKFKSLGVTAMKGDWTQRDENIAKALAGYGRQGVPLYVFFPSEGGYKILPEILTPQLMIKTLEGDS